MDKIEKTTKIEFLFLNNIYYLRPLSDKKLVSSPFAFLCDSILRCRLLRCRLLLSLPT